MELKWNAQIAPISVLWHNQDSTDEEIGFTELRVEIQFPRMLSFKKSESNTQVKGFMQCGDDDDESWQLEASVPVFV